MSYSLFASETCDDSKFKNSSTLKPTINRQIVHQPGRLYFYNSPEGEKCKRSDLFIIKGDIVNAYSTFEDYTYINYKTKKNKDVFGWVKSEALVPYTPKINAGSPIRYDDFTVQSPLFSFSLDMPITTLLTPPWQQDLNACLSGVYTSLRFTYDDLSITSFSVNRMTPRMPRNSIDRCDFLDSNNKIAGIRLLTNVYKTPRGITILSSKDELFKAYPQKELHQKPMNYCFTDVLKNGTCFDIKYKNYILRFVLGEDDLIRSIEMTSIEGLLPV